MYRFTQSSEQRSIYLLDLIQLSLQNNSSYEEYSIYIKKVDLFAVPKSGNEALIYFDSEEYPVNEVDCISYGAPLPPNEGDTPLSALDAPLLLLPLIPLFVLLLIPPMLLHLMPLLLLHLILYCWCIWCSCCWSSGLPCCCCHWVSVRNFV